MKKTIIAIGGGEIRAKDTYGIDEYIADRAKSIAGERRACGLFLPTASHDFFPYYNSFHKTYTGEFGIKTDVALTVFKESDPEKLKAKFDKADFLYVGGGDTLFMLESWRQSGVLRLVQEFYERGGLVCGLSAGAICYFSEMYTDSASAGTGERYNLWQGLGWVQGLVSPHYNLRQADFDAALLRRGGSALALEDRSAVVVEDGRIVRSVCCGGNAYLLRVENGAIVRERIPDDPFCAE